MTIRKSTRLKHCYYNTNGYYFITICTASRKPLLIEHKDIVESILKNIPLRFSGVEIDYFTIMPDHLHIIFVLNNTQNTIGEIIRSFKALVTKTTGRKPFWEWNYYDHVIRNEEALFKIRKYIRDNPEKEKYDIEKIYKDVTERRRMNATATERITTSDEPKGK
jgi:putative transposase